MAGLDIKLKPGKYIVAVSGGVDSRVLLDMLAHKQDVELIVAHYDHGIRADSPKDRKFVRKIAKTYGLAFEYQEGKLGANASEDTARQARYKFLGQVQDKYSANALITAHHRDDLLETAAINMLRGTGPKGLSSMAENSKVLRPLLQTTKQDILNYAKSRKLHWLEDSTNENELYLRNYVRRRILSKMSDKQKRSLLLNIQKVANINETKEQLLATLSQYIYKDDKINRVLFAQLPAEVASELIVYWLKTSGIKGYDRKLVERLNISLRTARPDTEQRIQGDWVLLIDSEEAVIKSRANS